MISNNNTPVKTLNNCNIYRITTTCHKKINGIWTNSGKIFYQKDNTKAVVSIVGTNYNNLISEMSKTMKKIIS